MEIASVRALKEELFQERLGRRVLTRSALPREALVVGSALPITMTAPPIALGISGRRGEYRLAVRLQAVSPGIQRNLDRILERARGEASVKVVGRLFKQQTMPRPRLLIGNSIGHVRITAGTLGCFVQVDGTDQLHVLSNNHVLADENRARIGDDILHPGPADSGMSPRDRVATLSGFEPLSNVGSNLIDAAVAALLDGIQEDRQTLGRLGALRGVRSSPIEEGDAVFKIGRTTGLTRGRVSAFEVDDVSVDYDMGDVSFDRQIEIEPVDESPFSLGGDSGSLIVDEDLQAVGLLFAGNDADVTYANPIDAVLGTLRARLA